MTKALNPIQAVLSIAKLIVLLVLPVVEFAILGVRIPLINLTGIRMMNSGNVLVYFSMFICLLMFICSIGQLQKFSLICAGIALVLELTMLAILPNIVQMGDLAFLLSLIPQEYSIVSQVALAQLAKPGMGLIINIGITLIYAGAHFFMSGSSRSHSASHSEYSSKKMTGTGHSNTNRPSL